MVRSFGMMAAIGLTLAPMAHAAAQGTVPPDVAAKLQQVAVKTCNDDLDRGHFGDYSTIEECVADKTYRLERKYQSNPAAVQAASGATHQPN